MAEVNLSTRTLSQLLNMYKNGTITVDELAQEIARRTQSGELANLRKTAGRGGLTWQVIDPFGELATAVENGRIGQQEYETLTDVIGPAPTTRTT